MTTPEELERVKTIFKALPHMVFLIEDENCEAFKECRESLGMNITLDDVCDVEPYNWYWHIESNGNQCFRFRQTGDAIMFMLRHLDNVTKVVPCRKLKW